MPEATFYYIPHTHWEGAVFKTRAEYLDMGLPNILRALRLLKEYPEYRFVLDQAAYVKPFLERYPAREAEFLRYVREGRLVIAGGLDVMPDVNMPGGETYIRQVLYGKGYFRARLGVEVPVSWQLDTFGHHAQMPQLLRQAGYRSHWFFRGVPSWETPSEFLWEGLDGTRIAAYWLPHGYAITWPAPKEQTEFSEFFRKQFDSLQPFNSRPYRPGPSGADVCEPEEHVPALAAAFNMDPQRPFNIQIAAPAEYEARVNPDVEPWPVIKCELNPVFQGVYSSRIELKMRTRQLEQVLLTAEKLGVLLQTCGQPESNQPLLDTWEPMIFNHAHDLMSGVMVDHVYADTLRGYDFTARVGGEALRARLEAWCSGVDTRAVGLPEDSIPLVVFNALGWARTDAAFAQVGFGAGGVTGVRLLDQAGSELPVQIVHGEYYSDGSLVAAQVAFLARDVPALGHAVYYLVPQSGEPAAIAAVSTAAAGTAVVLENGSIRLEVDPATGSVTRLTDVQTGWEALSRPGNVIAMEEDHGDLWEPYHPLDGGSRIAMQERHLPPQPGAAVFSTDQPAESARVTRGPVYSEIVVEHPFSNAGQFQTRIRLYAGLPRVEIHTEILNNDRFVRYRAFFPTTDTGGAMTHEIPFGAIDRPDGIEFPAQNWIDTSAGGNGLALLNRGLPGNNIAEGTLALSLLRSTCIVAYGFFGGYEPGVSSDSGLELGQRLGFDYALIPHAGDWRQAQLYRQGQEFNQPLLVSQVSGLAEPAAGTPGRWGWLEIDHPAVVLSALKGSAGGRAVLRLYEASGSPAENVTIRFHAPVAAVCESNLLEDPGAEIRLEDSAVCLNFHPFEIKTLLLQLG